MALTSFTIAALPHMSYLLDPLTYMGQATETGTSGNLTYLLLGKRQHWV